jgi:RimK family alpha-L-glutamate ligase
MKLYRSLNERVSLRGQKEKSAVLTFGRFQPPTIGHEKLVNAVMSTAKKLGADSFIFPSRTQDKKKNPLQIKDKVKFLRKFFPRVRIVDDRNAKTIFNAMESLVKKGYTDITLVVGGDRVEEFKKTITPYVDEMGLNSFDVVSAGERDPDLSDVGGMSASKMRVAVSDNDFDAFMKGIPKSINKKIAKELFVLLKKEMGLQEDTLSPKKDDLKTFLIVSNVLDGDTTTKLVEEVESLGHRPVLVQANTAYIGNIDDNKITIENINEKGKDITIDANDTIVFVRGSSMKSAGGRALVEGLGSSDMVVINKTKVFELTGNKYTTHVMFEREEIQTPRTALITNEASIDRAHEKVGGKFPVIVKSLHGAEGIGVAKIDSPDSFRSVVQSLKKNGEDILVQEMIDIDGDVRSIVMDGKVIASMKRMKASNDFRTNKALGAESKPYSLSENEKKFVKKIAKASGAILAGVDHAICDGKLYAIEVNASPGSGAEEYTKYINEDSTDTIVSGNGLVREIVEQSLLITKPKKTFEVGRVENVVIGERNTKARVDSGNSSYSVLGAEKIKENKGTVSFVFDSTKFKLPIIDNVNINMGGGKVEKRYVVEMDMKIGRTVFEKVGFSLSDRSSNVYPVLLGNTFMKENNIVVHTNEVFMQDLEERTLTKAEKDKKEKFVKGIKKRAKDFKKRYGADYKSIMYGTATNMAKTNTNEEDIDFNSPPEEGTDDAVSRFRKMTPGELNEIAYKYFCIGDKNDTSTKSV